MATLILHPVQANSGWIHAVTTLGTSYTAHAGDTAITIGNIWNSSGVVTTGDRGFFQYLSADADTGLPADAVITKFELLYHADSAESSSGAFSSQANDIHAGNFIGAALNGNVGEYTGGSFITQYGWPSGRPGDESSEWMELDLAAMLAVWNRDPGGVCDFRITNVDVPTSFPRSTTQNIKNGTTGSARGQLRITYEQPIMDTAALTLAGQPVTITPGAITVPLDTAGLTLTANDATVTPGQATVSADTAALSLAGNDATITPGSASVTVDTAALTIAGNDVSITAGSVSVPLDTALLIIAGQVATITPGTASVELDTAALAINGQPVTITPGGATVVLQAATLTIDGQSVDVTSGLTLVALETATLLILGSDATLTAGVVSVPLATAAIVIAGEEVTITAGQPGEPTVILLDPDRSWSIAQEVRMFTVKRPERILPVPAEGRTLLPKPEDRTMSIGDEDREVTP